MVEFHPRDPAVRADPYPTYAALRRDAPNFHRVAENDWFVSRHADVVSLLKDVRVGSLSTAHGTRGDGPPSDRLAALRQETARIHRLWHIFHSEPTHGRLRRLVQGAFAPDQVARLRQRIQQFV